MTKILVNRADWLTLMKSMAVLATACPQTDITVLPLDRALAAVCPAPGANAWASIPLRDPADGDGQRDSFVMSGVSAKASCAAFVVPKGRDAKDEWLRGDFVVEVDHDNFLLRVTEEDDNGAVITSWVGALEDPDVESYPDALSEDIAANAMRVEGLAEADQVPLADKNLNRALKAAGMWGLIELSFPQHPLAPLIMRAGRNFVCSVRPVAGSPVKGMPPQDLADAHGVLARCRASLGETPSE